MLWRPGRPQLETGTKVKVGWDPPRRAEGPCSEGQTQTRRVKDPHTGLGQGPKPRVKDLTQARGWGGGQGPRITGLGQGFKLRVRDPNTGLGQGPKPRVKDPTRARLEGSRTHTQAEIRDQSLRSRT